MTDAIDFERQLDDWFAGEAPGRAPDRILATAIERVGTVGQRRSIRTRLRTRTRIVAWQRALVLALVVLATVLVALLVAGALRSDPPRSINDADLVVIRDGHIVAIAKDGTERELGRLTDEILGSDVKLIISAMVSPDGHLLVNRIKDDQTAGPIVFDLRELGAPPSEPDVEGSHYGFGPDGTIGILTADGFATYDPLTHESRSIVLPRDGNSPVHRPLTPDGTIKWTLDGSGILAETGRFTVDTEGLVTTATIGRLAPDGSFTAGAVPAFDDGIGTRRVGPAGEFLRCRPEADSECYFKGGELWAVTDTSATSTWTNPDPTTRITDFSWAIDGGLWVLLESAAEGPRTVSLVHVSSSRDVRTVATFQAEAGDPDPNLYVPSARFAAIAPDDSRLVLFINQPLDRRVPYLVDPSGGRPTRIDREIAGWLLPDTIVEGRPDVTPSPVFDPALRGLWSDGRSTLRIGEREVSVGGSSLSIDGTDGDTVSIGGSLVGATCDPGAPGSYRFAIVDGRLVIDALLDPCPARVAALAGTYDTSVPIEEHGPARVEAGTRLRSALLRVPLALTLPPTGGAAIERHAPTDLSILGPIRLQPDNDYSVVVSVYIPTTGVADPCKDWLGDLVALEPGVDGVLRYVDGLARFGITRSEAVDTTFAGFDAVTTTLTIDRFECEGVLFRSGPGDPARSVGSPARLTIVQHPDGPVIVVVVGSLDRPDPGALTWADELVSSISFGPLE